MSIKKKDLGGVTCHKSLILLLKLLGFFVASVG
uniref:Uncharacterized protein n=2 Tax=unclassified Rosemountvirus TaxID=2738372 RepID=A0AAU8GH92_9CAUD